MLLLLLSFLYVCNLNAIIKIEYNNSTLPTISIIIPKTEELKGKIITVTSSYATKEQSSPFTVLSHDPDNIILTFARFPNLTEIWFELYVQDNDKPFAQYKLEITFPIQTLQNSQLQRRNSLEQENAMLARRNSDIPHSPTSLSPKKSFTKPSVILPVILKQVCLFPIAQDSVRYTDLEKLSNSETCLNATVTLPLEQILQLSRKSSLSGSPTLISSSPRKNHNTFEPPITTVKVKET